MGTDVMQGVLNNINRSPLGQGLQQLFTLPPYRVGQFIGISAGQVQLTKEPVLRGGVYVLSVMAANKAIYELKVRPDATGRLTEKNIKDTLAYYVDEKQGWIKKENLYKPYQSKAQQRLSGQPQGQPKGQNPGQQFVNNLQVPGTGLKVGELGQVFQGGVKAYQTTVRTIKNAVPQKPAKSTTGNAKTNTAATPTRKPLSDKGFAEAHRKMLKVLQDDMKSVALNPLNPIDLAKMAANGVLEISGHKPLTPHKRLEVLVALYQKAIQQFEKGDKSVKRHDLTELNQGINRLVNQIKVGSANEAELCANLGAGAANLVRSLSVGFVATTVTTLSGGNVYLGAVAGLAQSVTTLNAMVMSANMQGIPLDQLDIPRQLIGDVGIVFSSLAGPQLLAYFGTAAAPTANTVKAIAIHMAKQSSAYAGLDAMFATVVAATVDKKSIPEALMVGATQGAQSFLVGTITHGMTGKLSATQQNNLAKFLTVMPDREALNMFAKADLSKLRIQSPIVYQALAKRLGIKLVPVGGIGQTAANAVLGGKKDPSTKQTNTTGAVQAQEPVKTTSQKAVPGASTADVQTAAQKQAIQRLKIAGLDVDDLGKQAELSVLQQNRIAQALKISPDSAGDLFILAQIQKKTGIAAEKLKAYPLISDALKARNLKAQNIKNAVKVNANAEEGNVGFTSKTKTDIRSQAGTNTTSQIAQQSSPQSRIITTDLDTTPFPWRGKTASNWATKDTQNLLDKAYARYFDDQPSGAKKLSPLEWLNQMNDDHRAALNNNYASNKVEDYIADKYGFNRVKSSAETTSGISHTENGKLEKFFNNEHALSNLNEIEANAAKYLTQDGKEKFVAVKKLLLDADKTTNRGQLIRIEAIKKIEAIKPANSSEEALVATLEIKTTLSRILEDIYDSDGVVTGIRTGIPTPVFINQQYDIIKIDLGNTLPKDIPAILRKAKVRPEVIDGLMEKFRAERAPTLLQVVDQPPVEIIQDKLPTSNPNVAPRSDHLEDFLVGIHPGDNLDDVVRNIFQKNSYQLLDLLKEIERRATSSTGDLISKDLWNALKVKFKNILRNGSDAEMKLFSDILQSDTNWALEKILDEKTVIHALEDRIRRYWNFLGLGNRPQTIKDIKNILKNNPHVEEQFRKSNFGKIARFFGFSMAGLLALYSTTFLRGKENADNTANLTNTTLSGREVKAKNVAYTGISGIRSILTSGARDFFDAPIGKSGFKDFLQSEREDINTKPEDYFPKVFNILLTEIARIKNELEKNSGRYTPISNENIKAKIPLFYKLLNAIKGFYENFNLKLASWTGEYGTSSDAQNKEMLQWMRQGGGFVNSPEYNIYMAYLVKQNPKLVSTVQVNDSIQYKPTSEFYSYINPDLAATLRSKTLEYNKRQTAVFVNDDFLATSADWADKNINAAVSEIERVLVTGMSDVANNGNTPSANSNLQRSQEANLKIEKGKQIIASEVSAIDLNIASNRGRVSSFTDDEQKRISSAVALGSQKNYPNALPAEYSSESVASIKETYRNMSAYREKLNVLNLILNERSRLHQNIDPVSKEINTTNTSLLIAEKELKDKINDAAKFTSAYKQTESGQKISIDQRDQAIENTNRDAFKTWQASLQNNPQFAFEWGNQTKPLTAIFSGIEFVIPSPTNGSNPYTENERLTQLFLFLISHPINPDVLGGIEKSRGREVRGKIFELYSILRQGLNEKTLLAFKTLLAQEGVSLPAGKDGNESSTVPVIPSATGNETQTLPPVGTGGGNIKQPELQPSDASF